MRDKSLPVKWNGMGVINFRRVEPEPDGLPHQVVLLCLRPKDRLEEPSEFAVFHLVAGVNDLEGTWLAASEHTHIMSSEEAKAKMWELVGDRGR